MLSISPHEVFNDSDLAVSDGSSPPNMSVFNAQPHCIVVITPSTPYDTASQCSLNVSHSDVEAL